MPDMADARLVPPWLQKLAAVGWRLLAIVALGLVLVAIALELGSATAATLVALVLAAALAPTARRLRARGMSRTAAAAVTCVVGGALIVGAAIIVLVALAPDAVAIVNAVTSGLEDVREQLVALGAPDLALRTYDRLVDSLLDLFRLDVASLAGSAVSLGTVLVLGTFLTFFLVQDGDRGWAWLMRSLDPWRAETVTAKAVRGLDKVGWYLRRTALLATLDALVVWLVLTVAGVPLAPALAAVAFIAGFVPYLGAIMGAAVIALAALALGGPVPAVAVLAALLGTSIVAARLLDATPLGRTTDVHPLVVLFALPAGAALFGLLGLIVSLPIAVFVIEISRSLVAALDLGPATAATSEVPEDGVPVWLDRLAQWSWRGLVVAGLGFVAVQVVVRIPGVVVPALIAVVSAATLLPLVDRLAARGWSRGAAAAVSTVGATVAIAVAIGIALALTVGPLREVVDAAVAGAELADLLWLADGVEELGAVVDVDVAALLAAAFDLALALVLALLMTFFFLRDGPSGAARGVRRIRPGRREPIAEAGHRSVEVLAGYMVGTAIISAFGAFTSGLIMVLLGLPLALPIAVLTFFASFIPYVGSAITTGLALLVAIALGDSSDVVIMVIYTIVFNIVQGNFVTPLVYGRSLSLHPAVVLMAIPVGAAIAGILGMFLVVPIAAIVAATWRLVLRAIADEEDADGHAERDDVVETPAPGERPPDEEAPAERLAPGELPAPEELPGDTIRGTQ
jgi:predicted PurR-regulated permease PerM